MSTFLEGVVDASTGDIVYRAYHLRTGVQVELRAPPSVHTAETFPAHRSELLHMLTERLKQAGIAFAGQ